MTPRQAFTLHERRFTAQSRERAAWVTWGSSVIAVLVATLLGCGRAPSSMTVGLAGRPLVGDNLGDLATGRPPTSIRPLASTDFPFLANALRRALLPEQVENERRVIVASGGASRDGTGARTARKTPARHAAGVKKAQPGGKYPGFDTNIYPGDATMLEWRTSSPYHWVGYYLPAPCHTDRTWSGKRETLERMGWGLAIVYVGQQTWGSETGKAPSKSTRRNSPCSSRFLSAEQGRLEADDAIRTTVAEGFPEGATIFLDLERMEVIPAAMRAYYRAWTDRVLEDGRFRPGVYTHTHNAAEIYRDVRAAFDARGRTDDPPFWVANTRAGFELDKAPTDMGHAFAYVWQGVLDIVEQRGSKRLPIDVNVANSPSPSYEGLAEE